MLRLPRADQLFHVLQVVYEFSWQDPATQQLPDGVHSLSEQQDASTSPAQQTTLQSDSPSGSITPNAPVLSHSQAQWIPPAQMAASYPVAALPSNAARAVSALQSGQVIAVPTDTLYGLAADASSTAGVQRIYSIKHRQAYAPLATCVADVADLHRYCCMEHLPEQLLQQLLPGPVTLILRRKEGAPLCAELNPGLETIGGFVQHEAVFHQLVSTCCLQFASITVGMHRIVGLTLSQHPSA